MTRPARTDSRRRFVRRLIVFLCLLGAAVLTGLAADSMPFLYVVAFVAATGSLVAFVGVVGIGPRAFFGSFKEDARAYHIQLATRQATTLLGRPSLPTALTAKVPAADKSREVHWPPRSEGEWFLVDGAYEPSEVFGVMGQPNVWDLFLCDRSSWPGGTQPISPQEALSQLDVKSLWEFVDAR